MALFSQVAFLQFVYRAGGGKEKSGGVRDERRWSGSMNS